MNHVSARDRGGRGEGAQGKMNRSIVVRLEAPSEVVGRSLLWESMTRYRYRVMGLVLLGAVLGVVAGFAMTKKYKATAVATYAQTNSLSSTLQSLSSKFSGLASLAGISQGGSDNDASARTMLESRLVAGQLIAKFNLMPVLFPHAWDFAARKWKDPEPEQPTVERGIDHFLDHVLSVDYDNADSKVSVNIVWPDRTMAATLANAVIDDVNSTMRDQALREAEKSISFLNRELAKMPRWNSRKRFTNSSSSNLRPQCTRACARAMHYRCWTRPCPRTPRKYTGPRNGH